MTRSAAHLAVLLAPLLLLAACGTDPKDLTTRRESADVRLDQFDLRAGTNRLAGAAAGPYEVCGNASVAELLASAGVSTSRLQGIDLDTVRYRIEDNLTTGAAAVALQMTPTSGEGTVPIGSVTVEAGTGAPPTASAWMSLPFAPGGQAVAQHYLDNRDAAFEYCVEGPSDVASLSMTVVIEFGVTVTVGL